MKKEKKLATIILALAMIGIIKIYGSNGIKKAEYSGMELRIDGERKEYENPLLIIEPIYEEGIKTYMPMREILEELGYEVRYDSKSGAIEIEEKLKNNEIVEINILNKKITPNTDLIYMEVINHTEDRVRDVDYLRLEKFLHGKWEIISDILFLRDCEYAIREAKTSNTDKIHVVREHEAELTEGKYRLSQSYFTIEGKITKSIEFEVEAE